MPVEFDVSVVKVGNSFRVTIPKEIVKELRLKKGSRLRVWINLDEDIVLTKPRTGRPVNYKGK